MLLDDCYEPNMRKLHSKNKNLMNLFKKTVHDNSFELIRTDSGSLTVRRNMGGGIYRYIHSMINPEREAGIWTDCQFVQNGNIVILGCGLGYHILEFLKRHKNIKQVYLVEADESLFRLAMKVSDLSKVMDLVNVYLLIGRDANSVKQTLSNSLDNLFTYHVFLPATSLYPKFYSSVITTLDDSLLRIRLTGERNNDCGIANSFAAGVEKLIDVMKST